MIEVQFARVVHPLFVSLEARGTAREVAMRIELNSAALRNLIAAMRNLIAVVRGNALTSLHSWSHTSRHLRHRRSDRRGDFSTAPIVGASLAIHAKQLLRAVGCQRQWLCEAPLYATAIKPAVATRVNHPAARTRLSSTSQY